MEEKIKLLQSQLGENRVKIGASLSEYLISSQTLKYATLFIATTARELTVSIKLCKELEIPYLVIGSGSKIHLDEEHSNYVIIKNSCDNLKIFGIKGQVSKQGLGIKEAFIEAESAVTLEKLNHFIKKQLLSEIEEFKSVVGTIGGNYFSNSDIGQKAEQVRVLTSNGFTKIKQPFIVEADDIIISAVFHLKADKV